MNSATVTMTLFPSSILNSCLKYALNPAIIIKNEEQSNYDLETTKMIDDILGDLKTLEDKIRESCSSIQAKKTDLFSRKDRIVESIKSRVHVRVLEIVQSARTKVEGDKVTVSEEELTDQINAAIGKCIADVLAEEVDRVEKDKPMEFRVNLTGIGELKTRQESIPYEYVSVIEVPRPPRDLLEKAGEWLFKKKYYTSEQRTETRYSVFDVGINDTEVTQNIVLKLEEIFRDTVSQYVNKMMLSYYEPIEKLQQDSVAEIETAIHELSAQKL